MRSLIDNVIGATRPESLLVLLPPAQAVIEDFYTHGFISAVRSRKLPIDLRLAEITYEHVMAMTVAEALHAHVIEPAIASGYRYVWLAGISLGGYNALCYAAEYARHLAGICLIAPYPGTADVLAEIRA